MVQNRIIKSVVDRATMNRSYLNYFRNRNPFKFISNIFRNYKKSSDNIKRNQSEPTVAQKQPDQSPDALEANKPKSEINLVSCQNDKQIKQWNNSKFNDNASQDGVKLTSSNSKVDVALSHMNLKETSCQFDIDIDIQKKLDDIPLQPIRSKSSTKIPLKRAYPWQNFNLNNVRKPRYGEIKEVSDMRDEIIKLKKSILRKSDIKPSDRDSPIKEVKFNKTASMMIYPKNNYNVMKQARINLSTANSAKKYPVEYQRKKPPTVNVNRAHVRMCCPNNYRRSVKKLRKCLPVERGHIWYLDNSKKQQIF